MWTSLAIEILEEVEAGKRANTLYAQTAFRYLLARVKVGEDVKERARKYLKGKLTYKWDPKN